MSRTTFFRKLLPLSVLAGAIVVTFFLVATSPQPGQVERKQLPVLVETVPVSFTEQAFTVSALGVVQPARQVTVQPQVGGVVVEVADQLVPGGRFLAGETLLRIDPTDYRIAVDTADTQLAEAEANLALEKGRQEVARREWALFADETSNAEDPGLALREPQLRAAQAAVAAARARLRQAQVNLERTELRAPFNAVVRSEAVELGQTLSPQSQAAVLVGTDQFRVQVSVPFDRLAFVEQGASATVRYDSGAGTVQRDGRVEQLLSDLDPQGQMARVLVAVDDPLGIDSGTPPLLLSGFVNVDLASSQHARVAEIPRTLLREDDRLWIYNGDGMLDIRPVSVAWRREDSVLIDDGVADGELLITSNLATPLAGMRLRNGDKTQLADAREDTTP